MYVGRRALVCTLGRAGVRASELCDIKIGQLVLHGVEGSRFDIPDAKTETGIRKVEMTDDLVEVIIEHIDRLRRAGFDTGPEAPLFPNARGGRMCRQRVGEIVADAAKLADERMRARGLPPLPVPFTGDLLGEILYNKRYSLLWEFGHTWIDMLHYGRLLNIPVGTADPRLFDAMPIPVSECQPRTPQPTGCGIVTGFLPATTP